MPTTYTINESRCKVQLSSIGSKRFVRIGLMDFKGVTALKLSCRLFIILSSRSCIVIVQATVVKVYIVQVYVFFSVLVIVPIYIASIILVFLLVSIVVLVLFFRMPWLSFASHFNPSPNFVFFSLFVPYRITNPNKCLFIGEPSGFDSIW